MAYITWLTVFVWLPLLVLWVINWSHLVHYKRTLARAVGYALAFSIPWDIFAVEMKIWIFPNDTNLGVWIFGLPLEEYLFMIFVTLLISTVTLLIKKRLQRDI